MRFELTKHVFKNKRDVWDAIFADDRVGGLVDLFFQALAGGTDADKDLLLGREFVPYDEEDSFEDDRVLPCLLYVVQKLGEWGEKDSRV